MSTKLQGNISLFAAFLSYTPFQITHQPESGSLSCLGPTKVESNWN